MLQFVVYDNQSKFLIWYRLQNATMNHDKTLPKNIETELKVLFYFIDSFARTVRIQPVK